MREVREFSKQVKEKMKRITAEFRLVAIGNTRQEQKKEPGDTGSGEKN
jgi:hypothetical protein